MLSISPCPAQGMNETITEEHPVDQGASEHFRLISLDDGIWVAAHKNTGYAISNAGIIDLGERTLIFDTFLTPAAASDLKRAAMQLTGKSPSLVINSHFHNDHIRGNQVFAAGAEIISTGSTREAIKSHEAGQIAYEQKQAPSRLADVKDQLERAEGEAQAELWMWHDYYLGMIESHPELETVLPTVTLQDSLILHGSKRTAVLIAMGPGHTADDLILYLPKERIVFAGDLLFAERHPWLADGDPAHWKESLLEIYRWNPQTVVPGHGSLRSKEGLLTLADYISRLSKLVEEYTKDHTTPDHLMEIEIPLPYQNWWYGKFFRPNLRFLYREMTGNNPTRDK